MGRTLTSATQLINNEQDALAKFRRALRIEDQRPFDALCRAAHFHVAALAFASHLLPFEAMLLAMLIEEHKYSQRLETRLERLEALLNRLLEHRSDETARMDIGCVPLSAGDDHLVCR